MFESEAAILTELLRERALVSDVQLAEIQEEHADLATLKLEQRTPDAPAWMWTPVTITPDNPVVRSSTLVSQAPLLSWKTEALLRAASFRSSGQIWPTPRQQQWISQSCR